MPNGDWVPACSRQGVLRLTPGLLWDPLDVSSDNPGRSRPFRPAALSHLLPMSSGGIGLSRTGRLIVRYSGIAS